MKEDALRFEESPACSGHGSWGSPASLVPPLRTPMRAMWGAGTPIPSPVVSIATREQVEMSPTFKPPGYSWRVLQETIRRESKDYGLMDDDEEDEEEDGEGVGHEPPSFAQCIVKKGDPGDVSMEMDPSESKAAEPASDSGGSDKSKTAFSMLISAVLCK